MTDNQGQIDPIVMTTQASQSNVRTFPKLDPRMFNCNSQNHLARDCLSRRQGEHVRCYCCNKAEYLAWDCPGNGTETRWHRSRLQTTNKALPVIRVHANGTPCTALLDSECSRAIVNARLCHVWKKRSVRVTTISSNSTKCHGIGQ